MNIDNSNLFKTKSEIDAMMVVSQKNRRYFTGFNSTFGIALITPTNKILITDSRYKEMAEKTVDCEVRGGKHDEIDAILTETLNEIGVKNIGFEDDELTVKEFESFKQKLPAKNFIAAGEAIRQLRLIKNDIEIEYLTEAQKINDQVFSKIIKFIEEEITEIEIANEIERLIKSLGGESLSFDTIVASGTNTSMPHAHPTDKAIERGDAITMDFGAKYNGYCADMTRTVFLGKPSDQMKTIYNVVLKTQQFAIKNLKAGMAARDVDAFAREVLKANNMEQYFIHGLGHGLGIDIHEAPSLNSKCDTLLEPNMVITIEPGAYVPGVGGVRIEDMLVVKEGGYKNLTTSPKELIIL